LEYKYSEQKPYIKYTYHIECISHDENLGVPHFWTSLHVLFSQREDAEVNIWT